jgi:omega-6 fatty acid desaturase (delta-12 desaturase)
MKNRAWLVYAVESSQTATCFQLQLTMSLLVLLPVLQFELLSQQIALSYAMFLYSVEHTYEGVYRVPQAEFNRTAAGLLGSSYLSVPWWWRWATAGVEYHHFHHLNARVPCYRMRVSQYASR